MKNAFGAARDALDRLIKDDEACARAVRIAEAVTAALRAGHKVMACGNGGSSCDAAHFAEELTGRFRKDRPALAALACSDAGHITCTANDYGFEHVFSRWVEALGRPGDVLIGLSTSGNSSNVLRAIETARANGMVTAALLGGDGGAARSKADLEVIVPGHGSDRIQELHMLILHATVAHVENALFPESPRRA